MMDLQKTLSKIATPAYVYDLDGLRARLEFFKKAAPTESHIHYAMKANHNLEILRVMREAGLGVDVVSLGEMNRAVEAGFKPDKIVFSGVGKTVAEINAAISAQIAQINVESEPELLRIIECAKALRKKAAIAFRMNPDVDAKTHPYIRTGFRDNKFGLDFSEVPKLLTHVKQNSNAVELQGLTLHIGSQIREVAPFESAIRKTLELYKTLVAQGFNLTTFDVGGGIGIDYASGEIKTDEALISSYMQILKAELVGQVKKIFLEPGRILVARFGTLITEVQYVKRTPYKSFLIVDAGMNNLIRPALYQANHRIEPVKKMNGSSEVYDVVGPICESSDVLGSERYLPSEIKAGDRLAIYDVGAYGSVMSSDYNLRTPAVEVCVEGGRIK
jgi:diaminopimelate decarboxylase